jgi:site-specific DNA recombinase
MIHTYTCKGTTRYRYYVCLKATKQGAKICATRSIPAQEIEDFVVDRIATIGSDPDLIRRVEVSVSAQRRERLTAIEAEKTEMGKSLRNQAKMVAGIVELPNAAARMAELEERLQVGEARLAELAREEKAIRSAVITDGEIARVLGSFRTLFDSMPSTHRARAMELLLEQVTYDREKGSVSISFHPSGIKTLSQEPV